MNLKKILTTIALTTSLTTLSFSQQEKYSLFIGGSYMIPKKELIQDFNILKGLEISLEKPITQKSSIGLAYYSGYKWGHETQTKGLEPKINADKLSIIYKHKIRTSSKIKPFYKIGIGYEKFKLGKNIEHKRVIQKISGGALDFEIGTKININKRKNKEVYFGIEKELFFPNTKTNIKYSNFKIKVGIILKKLRKR